MKITLVGDTNIHGRSNPGDTFAAIKPALSGHDVLFAHAEGMFCGETRGLPFKKDWYHSSRDQVRGFTAAGFSGVSFASNVCAEREAVLQTIESAEQAGLRFCGIGRTIDDARRPLVIQTAAGSVAFLSRTSVFWPPLVPASKDLPGAATVKAHTAYIPGRRAAEMPGALPDIRTWADEEELGLLLQDIGAARKQADRVILSMHWGVSSSQVVQDYQREIAHAAIDAGVDLVMGHHPHVVQEVELHHGRPIFYSMGNFAFDLPKMHGRLREGLMVKAVFKDGTCRCVINPVQRNSENLVAQLPAADPAWKMVTSHLLDSASAATRPNLNVEGDHLVLGG